MKIGINASFLRKSGTGIGQVTLYFLKTLSQSERGKTHDFFLYLDEDVEADFLPANFQKRIFLPLWKRDDVPRQWLWEKRLAKEAVKDGCDVFLSLYQSGAILPKRMRHTMVVHDIIPRLFPEYQGTLTRTWYWKNVEQGIRRAEHVVAISENTKNDLVRELHIPEKNISIALPDVAPRFRQIPSSGETAAILKQYKLTNGYIYHGGGLEIRKNAGRLLRAYALLKDKEKSGGLASVLPPLVISGKIFPEANRLATPVRALLKELHLEESVRLLGFVPDEDLPALYRGALFFAYPSLYEGFGLPVLEALCQNVPVLSSQSSSLPEVGGDAVLYSDPENVEAIASGMRRLVEDGALRQTLISKSAIQAIQFSWDHFVENIFAALIS